MRFLIEEMHLILATSIGRFILYSELDAFVCSLYFNYVALNEKLGAADDKLKIYNFLSNAIGIINYYLF